MCIRDRIRLEQVVIQIFRNLNSGSDIVTIRRKDNCLEFGKFSLCAQLLEDVYKRQALCCGETGFLS